VKDYQLDKDNVSNFLSSIQDELELNSKLLVSTQQIKSGKWGMARLWRAWMDTTGKYMAANGCTMPLMVNGNGTTYGSRPFNKDDAHELFTFKWLGCDSSGARLSWSKSGRNDMRSATKGERYNALRLHECWATDKGIILYNPRDSEYSNIRDEQNE